MSFTCSKLGSRAVKNIGHNLGGTIDINQGIKRVVYIITRCCNSCHIKEKSSFVYS